MVVTVAVVRVAVVEDSFLVRSCLVRLLGADARVGVVGAAAGYVDGKHLMDQLHKRAATMDLNLTYDQLGNRLRAIGDVQLTYGRMGNRPRTLGQWTLEYHNLSNRLRAIGGVHITYRRVSNLPQTLGQWTLEYSRLGNLQRIGPYEVGADWIGNRLRTIGPLTVFYDRMGNRPIRVHLPDEYRPQWNGILLALFLMLYEQMRAHQEARMRWAAGI